MKKLLIISILLMLLSYAFAERKALVIANSSYEKMLLKSPVADADDMQTALQYMGFSVKRFNNLSLPAMNAAIDSFAVHLKAVDEVVFYYSGHGMSMNKINYLVPAGANLSVVPTRSIYYNVSTIAQKLKVAKTSMLILEASRPWAPVGSKSVAPQSFVSMASASPNQVIMSAAQPGKGIQNGLLDKSLFTQALLAQITDSDLGLNVLFAKAATQMSTSTKGVQKAWISGSLSEDFFFISNEIKRGWGGINPMQIEGGGSISW